jgi:hypothetical protein|nr:MAG TPA: hypothetical protein [Caudoviricetes sp.]
MWVIATDEKQPWYLAKGSPRRYRNGTVQGEYTKKIKGARVFTERPKAQEVASLVSTHHDIIVVIQDYDPKGDKQ